ncbi:MAG: UDP-N-acetylmuramate dehydrogenase, partial [Bacilli bacterium]|nr:UDP-N-acetylmuramate dehydrogenase [Bacilli bacterium]
PENSVSKSDYLIEVSSIEGLIDLIKYLKEKNIDFMILGNGSNVILDDYFKGAIIKLSGFDYVNINNKKVVVGAGTMMAKLTMSTINENLTGLEWAVNIPGTIGGSIVGNAGAYNSEIFDNLISIKVLNNNFEVVDMPKDKFIYEYRHTNIKELGLIVLEATFLLEDGKKEESLQIIQDRCERRKISQPLDMPSAGSVFRNPEGDYAGRLIEAVGLKGKKIGGAEVSNKHANFIVNAGNATSNDVKSLIKLIREEVKKEFNIDLVLEQEIINWK